MSPEVGEGAFLGIDLGTSGLKLTLVGTDGAVVAESEAAYGVRAPRPGHAETDPAEWRVALDRAAKDIATRSGAAPVAAVGMTGQMHGVVLADTTGAPVRPAVLWPDQRAASCLDEWTGLPGDIRGRLANPIVAGMAGPIVQWLSEHDPASLAATALATFPKDWLRGLLTGDRAGERSDASATLLWDVVADNWSDEAVRLAGLRRDMLPALVPSDALVGETSWPITTGAGPKGSDGIPVVTGGADTACALTALRATGPADDWGDTLVVNLGTGVQILRPGATAGPRQAPVTHLYADTDGGWYEMLAVQNGGLALSWVQDVLGLGWVDLVGAARGSAPGSGGATFLPFLTGERGGVAGPRPAAGWSGATSTVGRAEFARSAFEALAFTIRRGIEVLGHGGARLLLSGGGAREPWVRQLVADVLDRPVRYVQLRSASAVGAAALAARGVGVDLAVPATVVDVEPSGAGRYDDAYRRWTKAVDATVSL